MKLKITCLCVLLAMATACAKRVSEQAAVSNNGVPNNVRILLPGNTKNAEQEPAALKPNAVVISVPLRGEFYVGSNPLSIEELGDRIDTLLRGQNEADRIVYVAGGNSVDYDDVVKILREIRGKKVMTVGLLVDQSASVPGLFRVELLAEPDVNEDLSNFKPNPLMLVASISRAGKVELNRLPMGDTSDASMLTQKLSEILQQRKEQRAYKPGNETRTDLTEDERVEKTVTIKVARSRSYGEVVKIIDAVKGGRAHPIIMQLDDLEE